MGKLISIGKILLAVMSIGILVLVVKYAGSIRLTIAQYVSNKEVKGAQTKFEDDVKSNLADYTDTAKNQLMNIKISDIVKAISGVKKIGNDINSTKEYIIKEVGSIIKK